MRKLTKKQFEYVLRMIFLVFAVFFGWIKIEFGKSVDEIRFTEESIASNIQNIENISWILIQTPTNIQNYLSLLGNIDNLLYLWIYEFTNPSIKSYLKKLADEWVPMKIIVENYKYQQYRNTMTQLKTYFTGHKNVEIKPDNQMKTKYVHAKTLVGEDSFIIQTANLTKSSFDKNREHVFSSQNENVRKSLEKVFEKDWMWSGLNRNDIHPNLLICPVNCRLVIENILSGAQKSIWIQNQYITDLDILKILREKSDLNMKLILADTKDNDYVREYFWPEIVKILKKYYNHTKMILVDDKYLILSSINLSENSMDNNREIWIILIDITLISQFKSSFIEDWKISE